MDFTIVLTLPSDAKLGENGDVKVMVKGSNVRQELTAVMKNSIQNTASLNIDTDSISVTGKLNLLRYRKHKRMGEI